MTTDSSQKYVKESLQAAEETLREARALLNGGFLKGTVSRAYYAMFYAVQAALVHVGIERPRSHSGAFTLFGQHCIRTGKLDKRLAKELREAYALRQRIDYEIYARVDEDQVGAAMERAEAFIAEVKKMVAGS